VVVPAKGHAVAASQGSGNAGGTVARSKISHITVLNEEDGSVTVHCGAAVSGPYRGSSSDQGAAQLGRRVAMDVDIWHDARTWKQMHPVDQRLVSQRQYARCEPGPLLGMQMTGGSRTGAEPITHVTVRVVRVQRRRISMTGITQHDGKRVFTRERWRTRDGAVGGLVLAVDVVRVNGDWRWLLDEGTVDQLRAHPHRCWE
jgi:hypothetical protein